jgi:DNA-binding beta-propeller fold protein YncE
MRIFHRLLAAALLTAAGAAGADPASFYRLEHSFALNGAKPGWDYLAFDPSRPYLYIGRRKDGVTVLDVDTGKIVAVIENSQDANAIALVPEFDRGYTGNEDGSTTIFQLSTLKTIERVKFGEDADAGFYEPVTKQMVFTQGDSKALAFLDAKTGKVLGKVATISGKLDATVADGTGLLFTAERDRNALLRTDAKSRKIVGEWKTEGCEQPTSLAFDSARRRLFVGCRGKAPVLLVMDAADGHAVASFAIGRGNDGVIYDPDSRRIFTSNGVEGNLVIFEQLDADHYRLEEAVTTRPSARTMAEDPRGKKLYLVTAEGAVDPAKPVNKGVSPFYPNVYFDDSFTVLVYSRP